MIYVFQCIWVYLAAIICFGKKFDKIQMKRRQEYFLLITFVVFALIMGMRDMTVGIDTKTYAQHYAELANANWKEVLSGNSFQSTMEIGWNVLSKLCTYILPSYLFFQFVYAIVYCGLSAHFILKTKDVFVTTILFLGIGLYTGAFNVQRQFLAIILLANGYLFFKEKKLRLSIIYFICAILIHKSAFIFLIVLLVYQLRSNNTLIKLIPVVGVLLALNYSKLIALASQILPQYHSYYSNERGTPQSASGVWIIWIIIIIIAVYTIYSNKIEDQDFKVECIFSIAYVLCNVVGLYFNYFERVGWYFMPLIPMMFYNFGGYVDKLCPICIKKYFPVPIKLVYYIGLTVSFTLYYLLSCFTGSGLQYSFFW